MIDEVPPVLLRQAVVDVIPRLLADFDGDERNVLLTLARILVTLETGSIVPKDVAAARMASRLSGHDRELMERARAGYLGLIVDDWTDLTGAARRLAEGLATAARADEPR